MIEQEYGIKTNPASSENTQANKIIERIHQVLGNIIRYFNLQDTYVDDADPGWEFLRQQPLRYNISTTGLYKKVRAN